MPPNLKPWNPRNLKAPSSCCCTGCANKPGSCIRGWYLSRQLSKGTYRLWKLPRVDSQKLRSKKQKLLVQLLQKRWLLHLRLRGSSPGPSFPKRKSVDFQEMRWSVTNQPRRSEKNPKIMETWGFQVMATSLEVRTSSPIWAVFLSSLQWILLRLQTYPCGSLLYPKKQQI